MHTADYIKIAVYALGVVSVLLPVLAQQSFIAKSAARTKIVQLAEEIVAQIEATLQANPDASLTVLLQAGVAELKSVADAEIGKLGLPASAVDGELLLLLQRYGSKLPGIAGGLAGVIAADFGAGTVSGASARVAVRRGVSFARSIGPVTQ